MNAMPRNSEFQICPYFHLYNVSSVGWLVS